MRRNWLMAIVVIGLTAAAMPTAASEHTDRGTVLSVGWEESTLLVRNPGGFTLLLVDPSARIVRDGLGAIALGEIAVGDHVEYSFSEWAGMAVSSRVHACAPRQAAASR